MLSQYQLFMNGQLPVWVVLLALIEIVLKGIVLWKAARRNQLYWFLALMIINSAGILPLIYLLFVDGKFLSKDKKHS